MDSDGTTQDIGVDTGIADSGSQDTFCNGTSCVISKIYDQSGNGNDLTQAPAGGAAPGPDNLADASAAAVQLNGKTVYGVYVAPGTGYRNDNTKNIATGDEAQGIYGVFDGTHFNNHCCFDYGNAEVNNDDTGNGHMEALYFGTGDGWSGTGQGDGPWFMADLENYLYSGQAQHQNDNPSINARFVHGILKGEPGHWAIRGGDATTGDLQSVFDGDRPTEVGYNPMSKEGAIILGIGGDNSNGSEGTFYEGVMTSGYPDDDTENQVHADIINAKYTSS